MKRTLQLLLLAALSSSGAMGQINCANSSVSQKLVCLFPFSTGVLSNDRALGTPTGPSGNSTAFTQATQVAESLNIAIASQASQLPLASASAGTVVILKGGVPETFNNLGPILVDRAQTIGKGRVFVGFTASQFVFTSIDGTTLGALPFSYFRTAYNPSTGQVQSNTYTTESANLNFRINQYIGVATVGLSKRIDASVIVPWEHVSFGDAVSPSTNYVVTGNNVELFSYKLPSQYSSGTKSGVGDIVFNVKSVLSSGEYSTFAGGINVRTPTGDDLNFLGSGAWGFNPYLVYSYLWKISPHAKIGYQWNTSSELNNPTNTAGGNQNLPGGVQYDVGADWAMRKRLTFAGDVLGSQYLNTPRLVTSTTTLSTTTGQFSLPSSVSQNSSYSISNLSLGLKWSPAGKLVISGNVLIQLNNNGLHARPTPLLGISYKF
ncbi:MAG: hypothetical protein WBE76_09820 [Terracidiphilus sp.]